MATDLVSVFNMIVANYEIQIVSFNGVDLVPVSFPAIGDCLPEGDRALRPFTPEEAEKFTALDLYMVYDTGIEHQISFGQELDDWRAFCACDSQKFIQIDTNYLWLPDLSKSVWINPRIKIALSQTASYRTPNEELPKTAITGGPLFPAGQTFREMTPDDGTIVEDWSSCTLSVAEGRKIKRICNFIPTPIFREYLIDAYGKYNTSYILRISIFGKEDTIIAVEDLGKIYAKVKEFIDSAAIHHPKAHMRLEGYVREHLAPLNPENDIKYLVAPGWQKVHGQPVYALDGRQPFYGYNFRCGRTLVSLGLNASELWSTFVSMLGVSSDLRITSTMMAFQFMGMIYSIFEEADFKPQFALYLVGTTGSMKTALSKVIFGVFRNSIDGGHTFSDTPTSIEKYLGNLKDEVGLVDDFELGDEAMEENRQRSIFNNILRFVGDTKGKNRSNPALQDIKGQVPHGLVAMTGEQTLGKQSTRLRMVEVEVTKGDILGENLSHFQQNPGLWSSVCAAFLQYAEKSYVEITNYIIANVQFLRREYQGRFNHLRTIDQLITFRLIVDILKVFWIKTGIQESLVSQTFISLLNHIEEVLISASEHDEVENPGIKFLLAIDAMIGSGELKVASSKATMDQTYCGFYDEFGDIYLLKDQSYALALNYMQKQRIRFPFDMAKVLKSLSELGCVESFPNGKSRTYNYRYEGRTYFKLISTKSQAVVNATST